METFANIINILASIVFIINIIAFIFTGKSKYGIWAILMQLTIAL